MSNKIQKINNLKKVESFLQINYVKGYKYVDKAGEFVNALYKKDRAPIHTMNPNGMIVKIDDKKEFKVSPHSLWIHIVEPCSFDDGKKELLKKIELVNSIFQPEKYTRVGWRNYLVYECGDEVPKIVPPEVVFGGDFSEIIFSKKFNEFDSRIGISLVGDKDTGKKVVFFDIDIFKNINIEEDHFSEISDIVGQIEALLQSRDLLSLVNDVLTYGKSK